MRSDIITAGLLVIGDEILSGRTKDKNIGYIAEYLTAIGIDLKSSPWTDRVGSVTDRAFLADSLRGVRAVLHTATLHKPHIATHTRQAFIDTNISGTLTLLEEAVAAGVGCLVFTSSAMSPSSVERRREPTSWR